MGYERAMQADILALLALFRERVPDPETHSWVTKLASKQRRWKRGHAVFSKLRPRLLALDESTDRIAACQYAFEEACLKSLYNESGPMAPFSRDNPAPFDGCSPYWILKCALDLANHVGLGPEDVANAIGVGS